MLLAFLALIAMSPLWIWALQEAYRQQNEEEEIPGRPRIEERGGKVYLVDSFDYLEWS